jgi:predicted XRE-type DNA-binding protein
MRLRSFLMMALKNYIAREGLSQSQAAKVFGVTQPRVSDFCAARSTSSHWTPWSK